MKDDNRFHDTDPDELDKIEDELFDYQSEIDEIEAEEKAYREQRSRKLKERREKGITSDFEKYEEKMRAEEEALAGQDARAKMPADLKDSASEVEIPQPAAKEKAAPEAEPKTVELPGSEAMPEAEPKTSRAEDRGGTGSEGRAGSRAEAGACEGTGSEGRAGSRAEAGAGEGTGSEGCAGSRAENREGPGSEGRAGSRAEDREGTGSKGRARARACEGTGSEGRAKAGAGEGTGSEDRAEAGAGEDSGSAGGIETRTEDGGSAGRKGSTGDSSAAHETAGVRWECAGRRKDACACRHRYAGQAYQRTAGGDRLARGNL